MSTPAKKTPPTLVKKAEPVKATATKAPAAKQAPPSPAPTSAARSEPKKADAPEPKKAEEKKSVRETLDETAADRGWTQGTEVPEGFDAVYTKSNPVLGGYEHLRVKFAGSGLGEIEHENLNQDVPVPEEGSKLDAAVSILTGEPVE